jgi:hypothetical protein
VLSIPSCAAEDAAITIAREGGSASAAHPHFVCVVAAAIGH